MAKTRLSKATYVERGYGQVEPNHLSAQRTSQIYAQLPADAGIDMLENGQFVKYDYANGVVNYTGAGEWMLVYNPVKVYRELEGEADFAMIKTNYAARVYSPIDGTSAEVYQGINYKDAITPADPYEVDSTNNPYTNVRYTTAPALMPAGSTMVPRVFKTNVGDIFTTNTIKETALTETDVLVVGDDGYLTKTAGDNAGDMKWQVVKVYNLPDRQKAVKIMRIA
jgi:hypothetical protein